MKLGPILAALGGGLAGLGLQQGGLQGGMMGISPILAMLMGNKKKKKKDEAMSENPAPLPGVPQAQMPAVMPGMQGQSPFMLPGMFTGPRP